MYKYDLETEQMGKCKENPQVEPLFLYTCNGLCLNINIESLAVVLNHWLTHCLFMSQRVAYWNGCG